MNRNTLVASLSLALLVLAVGPAAHGMILPAMAPAQAGMGGAPMVEITKSCPGLRYVGRNATFEITVTNRGTGTAHDVVVTDTLDGRIDFVKADNNGTRQGANIVWRLGTLEPGASKTLTADYRCNHINMIHNTATVTYCAEASATCALEVKGIPAILLECVDDPDPIEINSTVVYTIKVVNQGSAVGTNIVIECTLPAEEEYVSSTGPTQAQTAGQKVTFAPLPSLAPKATATFKVTVRGVGEGDVRFRVEMQSDQIDSPVMETESTRIY